MIFQATAAAQEAPGAIRGVVFDADFDAPLGGVDVLIVESGRRAQTGDQGNYVLAEVAPGRYTLVFSKEGYVRQVRTEVVVSAGRLVDVNASLAGEYAELEEFVVEDLLQGGGGSEAALLELRFESPALLDSIGSELMGRAGASDASDAVRLIAGATVQDGKFAVIRGLPDRYVTSQLNGVRLPSADENTRAVELDQFPSAVIESVQVSKTFTPDQQGDASGGAVDVRMKGVPDEATLQISGQLGYNSLAGGRDDFLTYDGGGVSFWGKDRGSRDPQLENLGGNWDGAVGVSTTEAPQDFKWSVAGGGKAELSEGVKIGGFASVFYERDSSYYNKGLNDALWVVSPGSKPVPEELQGAQEQGTFLTALFDVTEASQTVQWGNLAVAGIESENHSLSLTYLYSRSVADKAILAEDTRGKAFFFPGHDPDDPSTPGHGDAADEAPYIRTETLEYTERTASTVQLHGTHRLGAPDLFTGSLSNFRQPEFDWTLSHSTARVNQPDKRQFGSVWTPSQVVGQFIIPAQHIPFKPAENNALGNLQRIFKDTKETSNQYSLNLSLPFERDSGPKGYVKVGAFGDDVKRTFDQDTFSNFNDPNTEFSGDFEDFWSAAFPEEDHAITASEFDVDYRGDQRIRAWYGMVDYPLRKDLNLIAGARLESTSIDIVNDPEENATWFPPNGTGLTDLMPGDADVAFADDHVLPSIGLIWRANDDVTLRAAYSQTIARQTFKELTPILQQEFLGGPIFVGNPELEMATLRNYDLRADYTPNPGGLLSASVFYKDIRDAIEFVQAEGSQFTFTTPRNYPEGRMLGLELEARQELGEYVDSLRGLGLGANATFIDSQVTLPDDEAQNLAQLGYTGFEKRDMTNAPEHLFNFFATYDIESTGTQLGLFYTITGDTLIAGAGESKNRLVPSVYEREFGTINATLTQPLGRYLRFQLQAKNLTDPNIKSVYRYEGEDYTRTSTKRGIDFTAALTARFTL